VEEADTLFQAIDIDNSGLITKDEFLTELSLVNCQYQLGCLKEIFKEAGGFEEVFKTYCGSISNAAKKRGMTMEPNEFK